MKPAIEHRVEQALLQAVRQRRQQRRRIRLSLTAACCGLLGTLLFWPRSDIPAPAPAARPPIPTAAPLYQHIATRPGSYTTVRTTSTSSLVVIHTSDAAPLIDINELELFALLPNAVIQIDRNKEEEVIWPQ